MFSIPNHSVYISRLSKNPIFNEGKTGDVDFVTKLALSVDAKLLTDHADEQEIIDYLQQQKKKCKHPILFHLILNPPISGDLVSPNGLELIKNNGIKIVITVVEFDKHTAKKQLIIEYMSYADKVIFLDTHDEKVAMRLFKKGLISKEIIPIPTSVPACLMPINQRGNDILVFGIIREGKGFNHIITIAKRLKKFENNRKILIVGSVPSVQKLNGDKSIYDLVKAIYPTLDLDNKSNNEIVVLYQQTTNENKINPDIPIELHLYIEVVDLQPIFTRCQHALYFGFRGATLRNSSLSTLIASQYIIHALDGEATTDELRQGGKYEGAIQLYKSYDSKFIENVLENLCDQDLIQTNSVIRQRLYEEEISDAQISFRYTSCYFEVQKRDEIEDIITEIHKLFSKLKKSPEVNEIIKYLESFLKRDSVEIDFNILSRVLDRIINFLDKLNLSKNKETKKNYPSLIYNAIKTFFVDDKVHTKIKEHCESLINFIHQRPSLNKDNIIGLPKKLILHIAHSPHYNTVFPQNLSQIKIIKVLDDLTLIVEIDNQNLFLTLSEMNHDFVTHKVILSLLHALKINTPGFAIYDWFALPVATRSSIETICHSKMINNGKQWVCCLTPNIEGQWLSDVLLSGDNSVIDYHDQLKKHFIYDMLFNHIVQIDPSKILITKNGEVVRYPQYKHLENTTSIVMQLITEINNSPNSALYGELSREKIEQDSENLLSSDQISLLLDNIINLNQRFKVSNFTIRIYDPIVKKLLQLQHQIVMRKQAGVDWILCEAKIEKLPHIIKKLILLPISVTKQEPFLLCSKDVDTLSLIHVEEFDNNNLITVAICQAIAEQSQQMISLEPSNIRIREIVELDESCYVGVLDVDFFVADYYQHLAKTLNFEWITLKQILKNLQQFNMTDNAIAVLNRKTLRVQFEAFFKRISDHYLLTSDMLQNSLAETMYHRANLLREFKKSPKQFNKLNIRPSYNESCYSLIYLNEVLSREKDFDEMSHSTKIQLFLSKHMKDLILPKDLNIDSVQKQLESIFEMEQHYFEQGYFTFYHAAPTEIVILYDLFTEFWHSVLITPFEKEDHRFRLMDMGFKTLPTLHEFIQYFTTESKTIDNYSRDYQEMGLSVNPFLFGNHQKSSSSSIYLFLENVSAVSYSSNQEDTFKSNFNQYSLNIIKRYSRILGFNYTVIKNLLNSILPLKSKQGGSLFQLIIPQEIIEEISYPAIVYGTQFNIDGKPLTIAETFRLVKEKKLPFDNLINLQARLYLRPNLYEDVITKRYNSKKISYNEELNYRLRIKDAARQLFIVTHAQTKTLFFTPLPTKRIINHQMFNMIGYQDEENRIEHLFDLIRKQFYHQASRFLIELFKSKTEFEEELFSEVIIVLFSNDSFFEAIDKKQFKPLFQAADLTYVFQHKKYTANLFKNVTSLIGLEGIEDCFENEKRLHDFMLELMGDNKIVEIIFLHNKVTIDKKIELVSLLDTNRKKDLFLIKNVAIEICREFLIENLIKIFEIETFLCEIYDENRTTIIDLLTSSRIGDEMKIHLILIIKKEKNNNFPDSLNELYEIGSSLRWDNFVKIFSNFNEIINDLLLREKEKAMEKLCESIRSKGVMSEFSYNMFCSINEDFISDNIKSLNQLETILKLLTYHDNQFEVTEYWVGVVNKIIVTLDDFIDWIIKNDSNKIQKIICDVKLKAMIHELDVIDQFKFYEIFDYRKSKKIIALFGMSSLIKFANNVQNFYCLYFSGEDNKELLKTMPTDWLVNNEQECVRLFNIISAKDINFMMDNNFESIKVILQQVNILTVYNTYRTYFPELMDKILDYKKQSGINISIGMTSLIDFYLRYGEKEADLFLQKFNINIFDTFQNIDDLLLSCYRTDLLYVLNKEGIVDLEDSGNDKEKLNLELLRWIFRNLKGNLIDKVHSGREYWSLIEVLIKLEIDYPKITHGIEKLNLQLDDLLYLLYIIQDCKLKKYHLIFADVFKIVAQSSDKSKETNRELHYIVSSCFKKSPDLGRELINIICDLDIDFYCPEEFSFFLLYIPKNLVEDRKKLIKRYLDKHPNHDKPIKPRDILEFFTEAEVKELLPESFYKKQDNKETSNDKQEESDSKPVSSTTVLSPK